MLARELILALSRLPPSADVRVFAGWESDGSTSYSEPEIGATPKRLVEHPTYGVSLVESEDGRGMDVVVITPARFTL
ncbi:hypothetical protein UFOVP1382_34 [uncultured Caudovirales phage]|uniref:Uncharacterized protein n=1 Tax=uncultured Caudovirales phage TaxID=2100421 RepID=A0A6J5S388_9CAUD|nr:hypothetical protein UFOVP1382_34 [uncultured Caudovirales phage]